ncbi:hypothetical protein LX15_004701 [Streptoalloteichus tenebrarius]|uniref:Uncharacterized protein n=1 Tax=Streptoalloteichus tenebrarius (strain ATCC 17920 / DSM 40477 / JCM 4838 / CBS 697.72 / NBRC 16177 / NCIMB 11028 / NRRL B-12390 / A12253. 1 / ISP 5477) TaxID=1933 RepID=A0ABT1HZP5_STRSD|nr:hypothetical protein [Streptoalloteichus tenebrarius]MCP2260981.1 hypothetical protein [Streptoalloteichus tenebrarius]
MRRAPAACWCASPDAGVDRHPRADAFSDYLADRIGSLPGLLQVETAPIVRRAKRAGSLLMPSTR